MLGLILAAGHSRRFGGDKRLASFGEQTLLAATTAMLAPHVSSITVVLRHGECGEAFGLPADIHTLQAPLSPVGMGTSLATAVSELLVSNDSCHQRCEALALMLGDMPGLRAETLQKLMAHARFDAIVRPCHQGRAGHPVIFGRSFWPALAGLDGDEGARALLKRHALQVVMLDVDDPGILTDIDTPDDLSSLQ
ncbi:nucleotidyltransferase family protein [Kushneria avicenniae]|uniref:nucleotidyltransferase family protein n=1 Tax=Kushneria avicenniae TaxID=402385 RepID=UPI0015872C37|nr:nucleotidyltransferase family protein [Kushneria avicenniae]